MDLITLVDMLEPHILRLIQSSRVTLNTTGGGTGGMEQHALYGTYHTGQLDESQALWVGTKITSEIASHAAQADVHHAKVHDILGADHTITGGAAFDLVGQSAAGTLDRITPSSNPGASAKILRTDDSGYVSVTKLTTPTVESPAASNLLLSGYNRISLSSGEGIIQVLPLSSLQTDNFASQLTGWRHTYEGELDTRYIYADQLKIKLFIADIEQALAGSQIISKSVTTIAQDFIAPYPGATLPLYVDDLPSAEGMQVFESGDTVRLRKYSRSGGSLSVSDCWGTVSSYSDQADKVQRWSFTRLGSATINTIAKVGTNQTASSASTTSSIVTKVSGTASGHYMLAQVVLSNTAATITPPTDWYVLADTSVTGLRMVVYYKIAGGSEPANYTWSYSATTAAVVTLRCLSNVEVDYSVQVNSSASATTSMTGLSNLSLSNGDYYLFFGGIAGNIRVTPPGGFTEDADLGVTGVGAFSAFDLLDAAGDYGDATATLASAAAWISVTVDLLPTYLSGSLDLTSGYMSPGEIVAPDSIVLDYGVSGNGFHEITAVDGAYGSNSPYSRVVSWTGHPVTGATVRTQTGNLKGLFAAGNEYGFYAGDGTAASNKYLRLSNINSIFNNIPIKMYSSGTEKIRIDTTNGIELLAPSSFLDDMHTISWRSTVGSGSVFGRIYNLITNAGLNNQTSTVWVESVSNGLSTATQSKSSLFSTNGTTSSEIGASVVNNSGSQSASIIAKIGGTPTLEITSSTATFSVGINANSNSISSASAIGIGYATPGGAWTTSGWTKAIEFANQGTAIVWRKAASGVARGIGTSSDGILYFARSTASDDSAVVAYDMYLDTNGGLVVQPAAGTNAIYVGTPNNQTAGGVTLAAADNGSSYGPYIAISRNSNASTPAAGWIQLVARTGTAVALWIDNAGNMRLNTGANPTNANDTSGTVVGTQTSSLDSKIVLGNTCTSEEAVGHVLNTARNALRRFKYKNGSFNDQEFEGLIVDYAPRYGLDRDAEHPAGKSLNVIQIINDLILSVQYLSEKLTTLEASHNHSNMNSQ